MKTRSFPFIYQLYGTTCHWLNQIQVHIFLLASTSHINNVPSAHGLHMKYLNSWKHAEIFCFVRRHRMKCETEFSFWLHKAFPTGHWSNCDYGSLIIWSLIVSVMPSSPHTFMPQFEPRLHVCDGFHSIKYITAKVAEKLMRREGKIRRNRVSYKNHVYGITKTKREEIGEG